MHAVLSCPSQEGKMNNKSIIGIAIVVIIVVAAVSIYIATDDDGYRPPTNVDHSLDTITLETYTWSFLDGWSDESVFIETSDEYYSPMDPTDNQGTFFSEHEVTFEPGSTLPDDVTIYVRHDGVDYWGYAWVVSGSFASNQQGTWSGTVTYTVMDNSEYNGTIHTLHYTFIGR